MVSSVLPPAKPQGQLTGSTSPIASSMQGAQRLENCRLAAGQHSPQLAQALAPDPLREAVEAIVLVVDSPVSAQTIAETLEVSAPEITQVLQELADFYERSHRGFALRQAGAGWRLFTKAEAAEHVQRFIAEGMITRLTGAAMETLAVVAYRQPVTRSQIAAIRGVNVDGVMRTLLSRGLVVEDGVQPDTGAFFYRTSSYFLERMGLTSLEQLPPIVPHLTDIEGLDEQGAQQLNDSRSPRPTLTSSLTSPDPRHPAGHPG